MTIEIIIPVHHFILDKTKLKRTMRQAGAEIARIDRGLMRQAGQGRSYGKHRASLPGSAAAKITGDLIRSVKTKVARDGQSVTVTEGMFYAKFLEAGAKGGGHRSKGRGRTKRGAVATSRILEPRPSLQLALAKVQGTLQQRIIDALSGAIQFKPGKAPKGAKP